MAVPAINLLIYVYARLDQKEAARARPERLRAPERGGGQPQAGGSVVFGVQKGRRRSHSSNGRKGAETIQQTCYGIVTFLFFSFFCCSYLFPASIRELVSSIFPLLNASFLLFHFLFLYFLALARICYHHKFQPSVFEIIFIM